MKRISTCSACPLSGKGSEQSPLNPGPEAASYPWASLPCLTLLLGMSKAEGIYMSADYRVTDARSGRLIDDASTKFLTCTIHLKVDQRPCSVTRASRSCVMGHRLGHGFVRRFAASPKSLINRWRTSGLGWIETWLR